MDKKEPKKVEGKEARAVLARLDRTHWKKQDVVVLREWVTEAVEESLEGEEWVGLQVPPSGKVDSPYTHIVPHALFVEMLAQACERKANG